MADLETIVAYQDRAKEDIVEAKLLLNNHLYLGAISRAYYAMFHVITAKLLSLDIAPRSHKQLGIEFRKHFIRTGLFPKDYSDLLTKLSIARHCADYEAIPDMPMEDVHQLINRTVVFVEALHNYNPGR